MPTHLRSSQGFILLEALVAMSLILTSWMALSHTYQGLALRFGQTQEKRMLARKELDQFEIRLHTIAPTHRGHLNEPTGMFDRASTKSGSRNPPHQK